jgi:hypothetical protein
MITTRWSASVYKDYGFIVGQCLDSDNQNSKQIIIRADCDRNGNPLLNDWSEEIIDPDSEYNSQGLSANYAVDVMIDLRDRRKPIPCWLIQFYYECM